METGTALIYGIIQGLSEFLPVSSSGHLALLPYLMEFRDPGVLFDLCLHIGTALAVVLFFRQRLWAMAMLRPETRFFTLNFVFATACSVVAILLLKPFASYGRNPWAIAGNQALFGVVLWLADRWQRQHQKTDHGEFFSEAARWKEAGLIGLAQAFAIFPGVSRSGITLTMAFYLGLRRDQAGTFSFLLSLPIILAGVVVETGAIKRALEQGGFEIGPLFVGVAVSFGVGLLTIHYFLKLIARIRLGWFTLYRITLALALLFLLTR